jgi:hypothetical protein
MHYIPFRYVGTLVGHSTHVLACFSLSQLEEKLWGQLHHDKRKKGVANETEAWHSLSKVLWCLLQFDWKLTDSLRPL